MSDVDAFLKQREDLFHYLIVFVLLRLYSKSIEEGPTIKGEQRGAMSGHQ